MVDLGSRKFGLGFWAFTTLTQAHGRSADDITVESVTLAKKAMGAFEAYRRTSSERLEQDP